MSARANAEVTLCPEKPIFYVYLFNETFDWEVVLRDTVSSLTSKGTGDWTSPFTNNRKAKEIISVISRSDVFYPRC